MTAWHCYILHNTANGRTYCGMTNEPTRRLRQHNREIAGGARATARGSGSWRIAVLLTGFRTKRAALQAEWRIKHPHRGRPWPRRGLAARAEALCHILSGDKAGRWTSNSELIADTPLVCTGDEQLLEAVQDNIPLHRFTTIVFRPRQPACHDPV